MKYKNIALLMGGISSEREVSLKSGAAVARALKKLGANFTQIDVDSDVSAKLKELKPDVAFNALHGRYGEDGYIQGILEYLKIPYTHSGVAASALAMDKLLSKKIYQASGIKVAEYEIVTPDFVKNPTLDFPFVIKPINEGSSVGVQIIHDEKELQNCNINFNQKLIAESYISGREVQVAVLGGKAIGAIEIASTNEFYDYEAKYTDGKATHIMPAALDEREYEQLLKLGEKVHNALGCRGVTRSDFIYDGSDFYALETNTQPGMTELSLVPEIAAYVGIDFEELVRIILEDAALDG